MPCSDASKHEHHGCDVHVPNRLPSVLLALGVIAGVVILTFGGTAVWTAVWAIGSATIMGAVAYRILAGGPLPRIVTSSAANGQGGGVIQLPRLVTQDNGDGSA